MLNVSEVQSLSKQKSKGKQAGSSPEGQRSIGKGTTGLVVDVNYDNLTCNVQFDETTTIKCKFDELAKPGPGQSALKRLAVAVSSHIPIGMPLSKFSPRDRFHAAFGGH